MLKYKARGGRHFLSIHVLGTKVSERVLTQVHTASKENCNSDPACLTLGSEYF